MGNTIDYAIDLGTTNSVITKSNAGEVEIFKNPIGQKESLPSVVAFRRDRIIVGDKAREYIEKDAGNVVGLFKRKMGTSDSYFIKSLDKTVSPVELSSHVLKELKNFVVTGEVLESAVITIPASFDTVQSNATKQAGELAGFKEISLLQEPIAAALAYINKYIDNEQDGKWIVYDLGGGTFDVALIELEEGELHIVDHKGDNYLGGLDFDNLIVDQIVLPHLQKEGQFSEKLEQEFKSASGKYHSLYYQLLKKAEDVKVNLSSSSVAEIEFEIKDDNEEWLDIYLEISKTQFEALITPKIEATITLIKELLEENKVNSSSVESALMIGGSTYIPIVRELLRKELGIETDIRIDPISAVAIGAAYYAGSKNKTVKQKSQEVAEDIGLPIDSSLQFKFAFQKQSQLDEEYFTAVVHEGLNNQSYRIRREDGGFDSGIKKLETRIEEDLPLLKEANNKFIFTVYDEHQNVVNVDVPTIEINQGKFGVLGQPLPDDICLEVDDIDDSSTGLELVFKKNELLPLKRTMVKGVTKTIKMGSDENIVINILEGPQYASPTSNKPIGIIQISGKDLERDLLKGTDVEIVIELSESRDLKVKTLLTLTDQEFSNVFKSSERYVNIQGLSEEIFELMSKIQDEIREVEGTDEFEKLIALQELDKLARQDYDKVMMLTADDVTDSKFQLEDSKRKISYRLDSLKSSNKAEELVTSVQEWKTYTSGALEGYTGADKEENVSLYNNIEAKVSVAISSGNRMQLRSVKDQLSKLYHKLKKDDPSYLTQVFYHYRLFESDYKDLKQRDRLFKEGDKAIDNENYQMLKSIIHGLDELLPEDKKENIQGKSTGIN